MRALFAGRWQRVLAGILVLALFALPLAACGGRGGESSFTPSTQGTQGTAASEQKPLVVATIYPLYDLARQIGSEYVEVYELVPPGQVPHGFEPTPKDLQKVADARLFIYNGAGMEATWIRRALDNVDPQKTKVVEAAQGIELIQRATGMQKEGSGQAGMQGQADPHFWTPRNMIEVAKRFTEALAEVDPAHKAEYEKRRDAYIASLEALDRDFQSLVNEAKYKEFYVSRPPFSYLAKEYGLKQISIAGLLGTEGAPTAQQIQRVVEQIRASGVPAIGSIYGTKDDVAETVASEAGVEVVPLHGIGMVDKELFDKGFTYEDLFRQNMEGFAKLLGAETK